MNKTDIVIFSIVLIIVVLIITININLESDEKTKPFVNIPPIEHFTTTLNQVQSTQQTSSTRLDGFDIKDVIGNIINSQGVKNLQKNADSLINNFSDDSKKTLIKTVNNLQQLDKNTNTLATQIAKTNEIANLSITKQEIQQYVKQEIQQYIEKNLPKDTLKEEPKVVTVFDNNIEPPESNTKRVEFPDDEDVINYDNIRINNLIPKKRFANIKIGKDVLLDKSNEKMIENSKKINNTNFPICDADDIYNTNINDDYDINITDLYRQKQMYVKSYLEDPIVRGYNVDGYEGSSPLSNTGLIKLEKEQLYPKPNGYIFKSSPAYKR